MLNHNALKGKGRSSVQTTLKHSVTFRGRGLHTGRIARLTVHPAPADHGIVFRRADLDVRLPARWDQVVVSPLNTRLEAPCGAIVSTIEHLMAALAGVGVHNALCDIDGPEVPILDGSAAPFARGLIEAGIDILDAPLRVIEVLRDIRVEQGDAWASLTPSDGVEMRFEIDFPDAAIGAQSKFLRLANGAFLRELADSRTFCRRADVDHMQANGLALGGSYDNAVVVEGARVLSPGGLRHRDEAVRHKMLDAVGDLYTAGAPILGLYHGHRAGHGVTNALLRALFADPTAWRWRAVDATLAAQLPGASLRASDLAVVA